MTFMDDEKLVWEYAREDFEILGYERFNCGLPEDSKNCIHLIPRAASLGASDARVRHGDA